MILFPIQEELKNILKLDDHDHHEEHFRNPILNENSPTRMDMHIHRYIARWLRHVYELFVLTENKEFSRYKNLFLHSLDKIGEQMTSYRQKVNNPNVPPKRLPNPSELTEVFIRQSEILLQSLKNSYQEEDHSEMAHLHSLLCSETAEAITLYTI